MQKRDEFGASPFGTRQADLKKSFKLAMRSLLIACSKQDICKAFPSFTSTEQECLHRLFIQVATSVHGNIEEEFESLFQETQIGIVLDTVEQLVEEQALDSLHSDKVNVVDVGQNVLTTKENEIQHLKNMLQRRNKISSFELVSRS
ncbi:uncharacterized protein LOC21404952 isoform X2 [Morus notabilis]|uniref:uncharacterized protein LOC21404952 isoform X2 n=1 Tax=Morus notabilis TaxID=981085 RepID=UPI000CED0DF8|nr:uncharacterized protein LOC21404952 isoform X2 [Morus notabilis]